MHMNLDDVASGHFVLGRDILCEFDYWPLAVIMPPTKVCPQCKAAVLVRRKTCKRCDIARNLNSVAVRTLISVAYGVISKMRKFTLYRICNYP